MYKTKKLHLENFLYSLPHHSSNVLLFALDDPTPETIKKGQEDHNVPEEGDFYFIYYSLTQHDALHGRPTKNLENANMKTAQQPTIH
jgi:hypothetical protein